MKSPCFVDFDIFPREFLPNKAQPGSAHQVEAASARFFRLYLHEGVDAEGGNGREGIGRSGDWPPAANRAAAERPY